MQLDTVYAIFKLAGIQVDGVHTLPNGYWPKHPDYKAVSKANPWWEVRTPEGLIVIGNRKRVIEISWVETLRRGIVTEDDVTKSTTHVHAWNVGDAVKYLTAFRSLPTVSVDLKGVSEFSKLTAKDIQFVLRGAPTESVEVQEIFKYLQTVIDHRLDVVGTYTSSTVAIVQKDSGITSFTVGRVKVTITPPTL